MSKRQDRPLFLKKLSEHQWPTMDEAADVLSQDRETFTVSFAVSDLMTKAATHVALLTIEGWRHHNRGRKRLGMQPMSFSEWAKSGWSKP